MHTQLTSLIHFPHNQVLFLRLLYSLRHLSITPRYSFEPAFFRATHSLDEELPQRSILEVLLGVCCRCQAHVTDRGCHLLKYKSALINNELLAFEAVKNCFLIAFLLRRFIDCVFLC